MAAAAQALGEREPLILKDIVIPFVNVFTNEVRPPNFVTLVFNTDEMRRRFLTVHWKQFSPYYTILMESRIENSLRIEFNVAYGSSKNVNDILVVLRNIFGTAHVNTHLQKYTIDLLGSPKRPSLN